MRSSAFFPLLSAGALTLAGCSSDDSAPAGTAGSGAQAGRGGSSGSGGSGRGGTGGSNPGGAGGTSGSGGASGGGSLTTVGGCSVFTADDDWNKDISTAPVDATWTGRLRNLVGSARIHPDYGGAGEYGIPINVVPQNQQMSGITFDWYEDESDPGPYPFPAPTSIKIEGNSPTSCDGDCHVLVVQQGACLLYEGYACEHRPDGWHCGGGAKWDLKKRSLGQRTKGWTSADAAGLPIMAGVLRYDEVQAGEVRHAIRFTVACTRANYVAPATHFAVPGGCSASDPNAPPMGLRVRLRADYDIAGAPQGARVVLTAMKRYGMILADNGSNFFFQGEAHPDWNEDDIEALKDVPASAFEVISPPPLEP
jgi:hypothetical protein